METNKWSLNFTNKTTFSRVAAGKRDTAIVITANGKEKLQKRHLYMHIKETYALFTDKYPNVKIGISKFASLRPSQVFLSSQVPSNVCTYMHLSPDHDLES